MMNDIIDLLFRSGIPYDPEKNEFKVRQEDVSRIEFQRDLMEQERRWNASSRWTDRFTED